MKSIRVFIFLLCAFSLNVQSQVAVKNNIVADALLIPNIGIEYGISKKHSIELPVYYNPWKNSSSRQFKLLFSRPELKYWFCEKFNGHYLGIHLLGGVYNIMGIKPPFALWSDMKDYRYKGDFYGAGVSYGYQFILGTHWNIEASLGFGYAYVNYKKYPCVDCGEMIEKSEKNYLGPTKAALNLIYIF